MFKLSKRLSVCADLVHADSRLADVGCDHGYVPVSLIQTGKIKSAIASDIHEKPLLSCKNLVSKMNYSDKIKCVLSNGLDNIESCDVDDILIAGMGGELIADILQKCDFAKEKHLILNPMTHAEIARKWLYDNGFDIIHDILVRDGSHFYCVFDAEYTGCVSSKSQADYFLGNVKDLTDKEYFEHLLNYLRNKERGGADYSEVICAIEDKIR